MKTLKFACKKFVEHLVANGTKQITADNYWRILSLFIDYLGPEKNIKDITARNVGDFYRSKHATMKTLKDGTLEPRAESSYIQIKRDVRLALVWFTEMGWIETVPLPPDERRFLELKPEKTKKQSDSKTKSKIKAKTSKTDKTMKATGDENLAPIVEPDTNNVQAISEPPETVENAISEPDMDSGICATTHDEKENDPQQKLRLL